MNKTEMVTKKVKSALPVYAIAAAWILYALIFPMYRVSDYLFAAAFSAVCYLLVNKFAPEIEIKVPKNEFEATGLRDADEILSHGREMLARLSELEKDFNEPVKSKISSLYDIGCSIYGFVSKNPASASRLKTFDKYYFIETLKILEAYREIDGSYKTGGMEKTKDSLESVLGMMEEAFKKQLDGLYEDKAFDIRTDIRVLETILKQEGLGGGANE